MRSSTANYDTENAKANKHPVVLVQFNGITREYSSDTFGDINETNVKKFIKDFKANVATINLLDGVQESGQISFNVIDKDADVTSLLNTDPLVESEITIKLGFEALDEADFVTLTSTHKMTGNPIYSPYTLWGFTSKDVKRVLRGNIGRTIPKTHLNGAISSSILFTVDSTSAFGDPTAMPSHWPQTSSIPVRLYVKVGDEIISYATKNLSTTFNATSSPFLGRRQCGTNQSNQDDGTTVTQAYVFQGMNPCWALLHILLTTDDGSGHAYYDLASFDSSFEGMGYGLSTSEVDVEGIERIGYEFYNERIESCGSLALYEEVNGMDWIAENILKPAGLILFINSSGLVSIESLDRLSFIENSTSGTSLTKDDVKVTGFFIDYKNIVNHIEYRLLPGIPEGRRSGSRFAELDNSTSTYGLRERPQRIESKMIPNTVNSVGLASAPTDSEIRNIICRRWLYTFGNPLAYFNYDVTPSNWLNEVTDRIDITHDEMPNTDTASIGWSSVNFYVNQQDISLKNYSYQSLTWELNELVTNFYSFTTVESGSIDDTSIEFNSNNSVILNTEDGYYDFGGAVGDEVFIVTLTITGSGNGTAHHWVSIGINLIDDLAGTPAVVESDKWRAIRYLTSDTTPFDIDLILFIDAGVATERIKIDWFDASSSGGEGGGTQRPTITFKELKHSEYGQNISDI